MTFTILTDQQTQLCKPKRFRVNAIQIQAHSEYDDHRKKRERTF